MYVVEKLRFAKAVQIGGAGAPSDVIMDFQQGLTSSIYRFWMR